MSETPFVRSKPVTQQDIAYSKNKIHIKLFSLVNDKILNFIVDLMDANSWTKVSYPVLKNFYLVETS